MKHTLSVLSAAIALGLACTAQASGQEATQPAADQDSPTELDVVTVVGIRGSVQKSLDDKREAKSHIEAVTAEDIGKLPAKNVADTLQQLPGVNISAASAAEGGFDENDRVSLRGTSPSLTQTLVNGHVIGTGDWFILSQTQTVGRSVSYSLLPSEIVGQVLVYKSSEAKLVEGGSAGSVNILTRRPLQFAEGFTGEAGIGAVYADLPGEVDPQFSALMNWKNAASNAGFLLQLFHERRSLRRDGQEIVGGFSAIAPDAPVVATNPDLAGVLYPSLIGATLFEQVRERKGGVFDFQIQPTETLTLGLNGFYSKMEADNFNRNYMLWTGRFVPNVAPLPGYVVRDGVLVHAEYAPRPGDTTAYGVYDQISRPGASSASRFVTANAEWDATDNLTLKAQAGTTRGNGRSPSQDVLELGVGAGAGGWWNVNGSARPVDWGIGGATGSPSGIIPSQGWIFGGQGIDVVDEEDWGQVDAELYVGNGVLSSFDFGLRYADHSRRSENEIGQGPLAGSGWDDVSQYPGDHQDFPNDFGSDIGGRFPRDLWYYTPEQLAALNARFANRDPVERFSWQSLYRVGERNQAAYVQANFVGEGWSGNAGLRYVRTDERINNNLAVNPALPPEDQPPGTINGSAFGPYLPTLTEHSYNELLPSANLKFDLSDALVARVAASKTLTRPDYSALAGSISLDDLTHTGSGGNPDLRPIVSTNFDAALEWYFAPRALLSASVYSLRLKDYVTFGTTTRTYLDQTASAAAGQPVYSPYEVSIPLNVEGRVKGTELAYQQPIGENFGMAVNYTYADSETDIGAPLTGTSKHTGNLTGYFENDRFNARASYTYRTAFYNGVARSDDYYQDDIGILSASLSYRATDWLSVTLDALNLNNPKLEYYTGSGRPHAFYANGRQYYVTLHAKF